MSSRASPGNLEGQGIKLYFHSFASCIRSSKQRATVLLQRHVVRTLCDLPLRTEFSSRMKILFVSTVPVFPPSDGVRIPPANYIRGLRENHEIHFLLLDRQLAQLDGDGDLDADTEATRGEVSRFWKVPIRRRGPKLLGLLREIACRGPYYGYWQFERKLPEELTNSKYDAIFVCTPNAIGVFSLPEVKRSFSGSPLWIAAMSDLHSLVVARVSQNASKNHRLYARTVGRWIHGLRSRTLAVNEMKMLEPYDYQLVQTEKEVDWIRQKGSPTLADRTVKLTNAVDDQLFSLPIERAGKSMAFVGVLSYLYGGRFEWFMHNVWKAIDAEATGLSLTAIGRGASEPMQDSMRALNVGYVKFVENLDDIYREHDILVAPIFKGYGLINKVVEAMASGCIVVGDATAFNGIPEFVPGTHGLVANTEEEFIEVLTNKLSDESTLREIRQAARELMEKHFRWSQRIETITQRVLSHTSN